VKIQRAAAYSIPGTGPIKRVMGCLHRHQAIAIWVFGLVPLAAQPVRTVEWAGSIQSGLADTFQLTLGGTFGNGPAWQNRVSTGFNNLARKGDSFSVYGWDMFDTRNRSHNWQAGIGYRLPVLKKGRHLVVLGSGLQHWLFPGVKTGTNDWLIPGNLAYQYQQGRFSFTLTGDSWTLLKSPLPLGSVLHTQSWFQFRLLNRDGCRIAFKQGPAHTYSWDFWNARGNRVLRYQTMLTITVHKLSIEGGYRKQWGLQPGIQDNRYWQFGVSRTFTYALR
jgi:hypothetical protein